MRPVVRPRLKLSCHRSEPFLTAIGNAGFCKTADLTGLIAAGDDVEFGRLLRDVLELYVRQIEPTEAVDVVSKGHPAQKIPPLHGRLTFVYHEQDDRERHFCFRVLEHARAFVSGAPARGAYRLRDIKSDSRPPSYYRAARSRSVRS